MAALLTDILGTIEYSLAEDFTAATISGYPPICTRREALQQVALSIWRHGLLRREDTRCGSYHDQTEWHPPSRHPGSFLGRGRNHLPGCSRRGGRTQLRCQGDETKELLRSEPISERL